MSNITSSSYPVVTVSKDGDQFAIVRGGQLMKMTRQALTDYINQISPGALIELADTPVSYVGQQGKALVVNAGEDALEFEFATAGNFLALTDTPGAYGTQAGKFLAVNSGETAVEFIDSAFTLLGDTPNSFAGRGGDFLRVNSGETALEFVPNPSTDAIVYVESVNDFSVQDATTITLESNKVYIPVASIVTAKRFIVQQNVSIFGLSLSRDITWTYTGTGDMFSGVDVETFNLMRLQFNAANANQVFNFSDTTPGLSQVVINLCIGVAPSGRVAKKYGTFDDLLLVQIDNCSAPNLDDGVTLSGTIGLLSVSRFFLGSSVGTFTGLDLGSSTIDQAFEISNFSINSAASGSEGISGLASSGNIGANIIATVRDCEFNVDTPLVNVDPSDIRYEFTGNSDVPDSLNAVDVYLTGGTELIEIASASTFVEIGVPGSAGVSWASDVSSRFSVGADGVVTYNGVKPIDVVVSATATVSKVGGGADQIEVRIAQNWVAPSTGLSKSRGITQNSTPTSVPMQALVTLQPGDDLRPIFANNSTTTDINGLAVSLAVRGAK